MKKSRKGLEIIDPFTVEYRELTTARSDAYYKKLYDEIFLSIPARARYALVKGYDEYLDKWTKPLLSLMNPGNWGYLNSVFGDTQEILENFLNLYAGSAKYLHDFMVSAKMIEESNEYFKLGRNIAATPSEIIHETSRLQLRRYIPKGQTVYKTPLLMIYSTINSYYILDLVKGLSMISYFVDKGYEVFVTDWKLITKETSSSTLEDYISEIVEAKEVIRKLTAQEEVGGLGYCIGGTYLDIDAALNGGYRYAINLATLLNSKVGEEGAGLLGAFSDFSINDFDGIVKKHDGVFPGEVLRSFFDWVKPEKAAKMLMDLYFYGKEYQYANDAVYFWNNYSSRDVAAPAHRQFLWDIYYENNLANGTMMLFGRNINLKNITIPFCNVTALFDHIVPFPNALSTAYLIGTPPEKQTTIKVEGGHVRGVLNPTLYPVLEEFTRQYSESNDRPVQHRLGEKHRQIESITQKLSPGSPLQEKSDAFPLAA